VVMRLMQSAPIASVFDEDGLFGAGGGSSLGGGETVRVELGDRHVRVAVFLSQVEHLGSSHVAKRVALAEVGVNEDAHSDP